MRGKPLHRLRHKPVGKPRRIAHERVDPIVGLREPQRARQVAHVVAPDVVTPLVVQIAERLERRHDRLLIIGVDGQAIEDPADLRDRVAGCARGGPRGELGDELIEAAGVGDNTLREVQLAVKQLSAISRIDRDPALGHQRLVRLLPADAVSEVDRDAERRPVHKTLFADRQQVRHASERDGDGVKIDSGDLGYDPSDASVFEFPACSAASR